MYKLTEGKECGLRIVTPKSIKVLIELGFLNLDPDKVLESVDKVFKILTDEKALMEFVNVIFLDTEGLNPEEINLGEVTRGYKDFLSQLGGFIKG